MQHVILTKWRRRHCCPKQQRYCEKTATKSKHHSTLSKGRNVTINSFDIVVVFGNKMLLRQKSNVASTWCGRGLSLFVNLILVSIFLFSTHLPTSITSAFDAPLCSVIIHNFFTFFTLGLKSTSFIYPYSGLPSRTITRIVFLSYPVFAFIVSFFIFYRFRCRALN